MTTSWTTETTFDATPETLLAVMTDVEFQKAQQLVDPGTKDATVKEVSRTDSRVVLEIHAVEYARGLTGVDKSRTEDSVTTVEWDLKTKVGTWRYVNAQGARIRVEGSDRIQAAGDKARLVSKVEMEIKVPLIGKKIEAMIQKEIQKGRTKYEHVVREYCKKLG